MAHDYDAWRPVASAEAVPWLVPDRAVDVIDIGAGTGLFTQLLDTGRLRVRAIDPDGRMLEVLRSRCLSVEILVGTAEAMPVPDRSADAIVASTAWQWFDPPAATREFARVLRPGGTVSTVGTILDPTVDWVDELIQLLVIGQGRSVPWDRVAAPQEGPFTSVESATFHRRASVEIETVLGEVSAWSPVIAAAPATRRELRGRAELILRRHSTGGRLSARWRSLCFRCTRR